MLHPDKQRSPRRIVSAGFVSFIRVFGGTWIFGRAGAARGRKQVSAVAYFLSLAVFSAVIRERFLLPSI